MQSNPILQGQVHFRTIIPRKDEQSFWFITEKEKGMENEIREKRNKNNFLFKMTYFCFVKLL